MPVLPYLDADETTPDGLLGLVPIRRGRFIDEDRIPESERRVTAGQRGSE